MWTAFVRSAIYLIAIVFLMRVLRWILDPVIAVATSGPHASDPAVQQVGGYFGALSLNNLTVIGGLAVAIFLLGRAAVEQRLTG